MKIYTIILAAGFVLILTSSCKQRNTGRTAHNTPVESSKWENNIRNIDSVLHFNSWSELEYVNDKIVNLEFPQLEKLSNNKKFRSQLFILKKIQAAEEAAVDEFYKNHEQITIETLRKPGYPRPAHTAIYNQYVKSGMIAVEEDSDTASVYHLNTLSPDISAVLNEYGMVIVSDTAYQFSDSQIKRAPIQKLGDWRNLINIQNTVPDKGIEVFSPKINSRNQKDWSGNLVKPWTTTGLSNRARYTRVGWSSTSEGSASMPVKYYLLAEAQTKKGWSWWGKWVYSPLYRPIFRFNGNWYGYTTAGYCTDPYPSDRKIYYLSQLVVNTGVTPPPMVNRIFHGNYGLVKLHPHKDGYWQLNAPWCWGAPFYSNDINITGTADGIALTGG